MDTVQDFFSEQKNLLNHFFNHLHFDQIESSAELILNCKGLIFFTGMGKSGIIAKNISQLLVSTGFRAMHLNPTDALHGDVGILGSQDILFVFSRSGQTGELLNMIPACRNKGTYLVAVVSNSNCKLSQQCHQTVYLPLKKELCPFDMAPTTSSIIQLIFGNTLVAYLMKKKNLTKEEYAKNHPAGRIGKRLTIRVNDVMIPRERLPLCQMDDVLINKIGLMSDKKCGCLLIEDPNTHKLLGIYTDGDLRRSIELFGSDCLNKFLSDVMTVDPVSLMIDEMAFTAMKYMEQEESHHMDKKRVKELPIVDQNDKLIGLVTLHDLVKYGL